MSNDHRLSHATSDISPMYIIHHLDAKAMTMFCAMPEKVAIAPMVVSLILNTILKRGIMQTLVRVATTMAVEVYAVNSYSVQPNFRRVYR